VVFSNEEGVLIAGRVPFRSWIKRCWSAFLLLDWMTPGVPGSRRG